MIDWLLLPFVFLIFGRRRPRRRAPRPAAPLWFLLVGFFALCLCNALATVLVACRASPGYNVQHGNLRSERSVPR